MIITYCILFYLYPDSKKKWRNYVICFRHTSFTYEPSFFIENGLKRIFMGDEKEVVCICIVSVYRVIEGVPEEACQTETLDIRFYVYLTKITLIRKCLKRGAR